MLLYCFRVSGIIFILLFISLRLTFAGITIEKTNFSEGGWIKPDDSITITFDRLPTEDEGYLSIFLGSTDITSLFRIDGNQLTYDSSIIPLASGESDIIVYMVSEPEKWEELARIPIKILTKAGFEKSEIKPRLDVNVKHQFHEERNADAGPEIRSSPFTDLTIQGGFTTEHRRGDFDLNSNFNVFGSSLREEALRFSEKGDSAPKVDLSDYLIVIDKDSSKFSVGHVSYGNNRHLLNNINNRGMILQHKFFERFDISLSSMNGTSIVGWDNFVGLSDLDHNITAGTIGMELLKNRPGDLRLEIMYMDGSIKPLANFNQGEVVDAEKSNGFGVRLQAQHIFGRLRADASFARSTFENPTDPQLSQGVDLVEVEKTTENARYIEIAYDVVKNKEVWRNKFFFLTLLARHERVDPQYKSLGVFTNTNQLMNQFELNGNFADINVQYQHTRTEDNLDDIPTILKTKSHQNTVNLNIPLQNFLNLNGSVWIPTLTYGFNKVHQFGANRPAFDDSGFQESQIPDQANVTHDASLNWFGTWWNIGYRFSHSEQDNRQPGRENADFKTLANDVTFGIRPLTALDVNLGFGRIRADDEENDIKRYTDNINLGFNWRFWKDLSLSGNYSYNEQTDSKDQSVNRGYTTETQLAWQFKVTDPLRRKLPGRVFIRHALQNNLFTDNVFAISTDARVWIIAGGMSISLF